MLPESKLLSYKKMVVELIECGFKLNPYDHFVTKKIINGLQMTVTWHVDNLKRSNVEPVKTTKMIFCLTTIYGEKITATRDVVPEYLGMDFNFSEQGTV